MICIHSQRLDCLHKYLHLQLCTRSVHSQLELSTEDNQAIGTIHTIHTSPEMAAERRMELDGGELVVVRWDGGTLELASEKVPEETEEPCEL